MQCIILLVADGFAQDQNTGKWNLVGVFNTLNAARFPIETKGIPVFIRLLAEPTEYNARFQLQVDLSDEDGKVVSTWSKEKTVPTAKDGRMVFLDQVFGFPEGKITKPGPYQISVFVDGDEKAIYPLEVVHAR